MAEASSAHIPTELRYSNQHEWVRLLNEHMVQVGITDFAQDSLGDIVYVTTPEIGAALVADQACGEVESTKSVSDLYAPVSGTVTAVNPVLAATPELINTDPYGQGWILELRIEDPSLLAGLLDADSYAQLVEQSR